MKKLIKILVLCLIFSLSSCTDKDKIATENGEVIEISNYQSINKEDSTTPNSDGGVDPDLEEE